MSDLHPDVVLAIKHREELERRTALRESDPDPVAELREAMAELAGIVSDLCAWIAGDAATKRALLPHNEVAHEEAEWANAMQERAAALEGRLR